MAGWKINDEVETEFNEECGFGSFRREMYFWGWSCEILVWSCLIGAASVGSEHIKTLLFKVSVFHISATASVEFQLKSN